MTFDDYQARALSTAIYNESIDKMLQPIRDACEGDQHALDAIDHVRHVLSISYSVLGLVGEAGEIANKAKKVIRDQRDPSELAPEVGDVLWYSADLASNLGVELGFIATHNAEKLAQRQQKGTIKGEGDDR